MITAVQFPKYTAYLLELSSTTEWYKCQTCEHTFAREDKNCVANPLALFGPSLRAGKLIVEQSSVLCTCLDVQPSSALVSRLVDPLGCGDLSVSQESQELSEAKCDHHLHVASGQLHFVVLEPGWVQSVAIVEKSALELAKYRQLAQSVDDDSFEFKQLENCQVLYRTFGARAQLVLPRVGGFCELMCEELHSSKMAGHMGIRKTMVALAERVWQPSMLKNVQKFVGSCQVW